MKPNRYKHGATLVVCGLAAAMALAACSSGSTPGANGTSTGSLRTVKKVTYVNPLPVYPAFNIAGDCFKTQSEKYGWQVTQVGITGSAVDNQGSLNQISQAIASGADGLLMFPTVDQMFAPVMKQARAKGMYVVALNTGDPSDGQQTTVGSDNAQTGALMADSVGAKNPEAAVGFLSLSATQRSHAEVTEGFKKEAQAKFPKMTFPVIAYDNGDATKDVDIFDNMLRAHPELTTLVLNEGAAIAPAITAVKESGKTGKVDIVGLDLTDQTRAAIEAGTLYGVVNQGWCDMGTKAAIAIKDLSDGKPVPQFIPAQLTFISKSNLPAQ
jgi:ABC-type sugar transport system substrate-binding protein